MAPWWVSLILFVISFVLSRVFAPNLDEEKRRPAGLGDFNFPTATEGRPIPVIWGKVRITGPNVIWYGHLKANPVTEDDRIKWFRYFIGLQFALCRGPIENLTKIWMDDEEVYTTPIASGQFTVFDPNFFGGEGDDTTNGGGINGVMNLFPGTEFQAVSSYLAPFQSPQPAYRGTCYLTWEQGYIGNRPSLVPWSFEVERYPNGLNIPGGRHKVGEASNPMAVLYEILNNDEWGRNIGVGDINVVELRSVADVLWTEDNGWRFVWDREMQLAELIAEIERQVDGHVIIDPATGQYSFKLVRFDYTPSAVEVLDESVILEINNFTRPTWDETLNVMRVQFTDPRKLYGISFALAQDQGNQEIVQSNNVSTIVFPGCFNHSLANKLAWRELRQVSYPLAAGNMTVDRSQYGLLPGDVRKLTWGKLNQNELLIRVTKVDYGKLEDNKIVIDFVEDIFILEIGTFTDPGDTNWIPPSLDPAAFLGTQQIALETPFVLNQLDSSPTAFPRITSMARIDSGAAITYEIRTRDDADEDGHSGAYIARGLVVNGFTHLGELNAALVGMVNALPADGTEDIVVKPLSGETLDEFIESFTTDDINNNGTGLIVIDPGGTTEEWIVCQGVSDSGANIQLNDCYRGALDRAIYAHAIDAQVWFTWLSGRGISVVLPPETVTHWWEVKLIPFSSQEELAEGSATAINDFEITDPAFRYLRPLIPRELLINDVRMPTSADDDFATGSGAGYRFNFTRRQWRTPGAHGNVTGLDVDHATPFAPANPNSDKLKYNYFLYDLDSHPTPVRGDEDIALQTNEGADEIIILKSEIATAMGGSTPSSLRIEIEAVHDPQNIGGNPTDVLARDFLIFDFDTT